MGSLRERCHGQRQISFFKQKRVRFDSRWWDRRRDWYNAYNGTTRRIQPRVRVDLNRVDVWPWRQFRYFYWSEQHITGANSRHFYKTTIRILGRFLLTYHLSDEDPLCLEKAIELAERMIPAFITPSGLPSTMINSPTCSHLSKCHEKT